jgi:hypothetical protein
MDDLDKLAAARDRAPQPLKRDSATISERIQRYTAMIAERIQRNSATISARIRSVVAWVNFVALIAFLPVPVIFFVVSGIATPLLVMIYVTQIATQAGISNTGSLFATVGIFVSGWLLATVAAVIYMLPCWGITRLLARGMRALPSAYAISATMIIVTLLIGMGRLKIYGMGHNTISTRTAMERYAELWDDWHNRPEN